ncbi:MAG: GNAT family N-acetyltransferase [Dehalococcoidia bacterium]
MSTLHPVDQSLLARCLENTFERFRQAARATDGRLLVEGDGLLLIAAEGLPWLTIAAMTRMPPDPMATLRRAQAFFAERGLAWGLTAAGDVAEAVAPAAEAVGLTPGEHMPGMLLAPLVGEVPVVPGLTIREVRDAADLDTFNATSGDGFGGGEHLYRLLYQPQMLDRPGSTLYLGYLDGEPVATALRITGHGIAGIGGVSTIPAARRRGIGEAITRHAALDGLADGCRASFLQATAMGFDLYQRMGYRHVIDFHTWEPRA